MRDLDYLKLLAKEYPTVKAASSEIINLMAIRGLPKGTEYFFSDLHGEYEAFIHLLRSASGIIREKISETFGYVISDEEEIALANLIYYPERNIRKIQKAGKFTEDWQRITIYRLVRICKEVSSKFTRSKVRKKMPPAFAYIIDELLHVDYNDDNKKVYYDEIIHSIIDIEMGDQFIMALCNLIQNLTVDSLHIIGDIFDRGPRADIIMNELMHFHDVDIQWGNHDISWMGAATGNLACICNVLRIAIRYNGFDVLEDGYGINLLPLAAFALRIYGDDPCICFRLKAVEGIDPDEMQMNMRIHKAISIIQFKVEGQIIRRQKAFHLENRALLHRIDFEKGTIELDGKKYPLLDTAFPTVDPKDPYAFTQEEEEIMKRLEKAFLHCEKLQRHMRFLLNKGSLYKVYNDNLLYHGCVPLTEDGKLKEIRLFGKSYGGKELYDVLDSYVRKGFFALDENERQDGKDIMWYIWLHPDSPLFGKDKMATFERYFLQDAETHIEKKNPYYSLLENEKVINQILEEFGLDPAVSHIVNGHVPVKRKDGENPVKCGGKVLVIDGGFSKAYQKETGIAGYTLIFNSYGLLLVAHEPFESTESAIAKEKDIHSETMIVKRVRERLLVGDTDIGEELKRQVKDLERLLVAYRNGELREKR